MAKVTKGGNDARKTTGGAEAAPTLSAMLDADEANRQTGVRFEADDCDALFLRAPGPMYDKATGANMGWDPGIHLEFDRGGMTQTYEVDTNPFHKRFVDEVNAIIAMGHPDCVQYNIRVHEGNKAVQPFKRWNSLNAEAIKYAMIANLDEDDHDENVRIVKEAGRYERENKNRAEVLAVLDGLIATEAAVSDAFDVEVTLA